MKQNEYIENILTGKNIVVEKEYITDELYNKEKIIVENEVKFTQKALFVSNSILSDFI